MGEFSQLQLVNYVKKEAAWDFDEDSDARWPTFPARMFGLGQVA